MNAVIRNYTGSPGLADDLKKSSKEIENEISSIPGFIAYYMIKTNNGMASVTVAETDKACDESNRRAANWLKQNRPNVKISPPEIISGELAFKFANYKTTV